MQNPPVIRRATASDLPAAAEVLAAAFSSYPWTRWSIPAEGYADRLEELQHLYLVHALDHGLVLVDERVRSVAAFLPPDAPSLAADVEERVAALHGDRLAALAELSVPEAPDGAWTLATVGVDPAHQGAGLGTAITAAGLEEIDGDPAPVALETSDDRNVRLYQRLGFVIDATTTIPDGPPVYSMSRPRR
ncbi:ribosomal protein S18 acetylase RimI-like enzyme [Microbacterium resistens]|uniref:Ribosomal protein S18 acetylase RimI-like enzyme n=1 Tax=Microbacterium resistens TaxID=156977 RepID=A0ABU1SBV5_9MICO|nr:GNAT family N-acetyltransferase [Microbacterium resistens]MDR6866393.1 ribosomal protein S18 acetylase RimI-like enzyme [Microbacterium resistens]